MLERRLWHFDGKRSLRPQVIAPCLRFSSAFVPVAHHERSFTMQTASKLDVDRYGVPQYNGEPELYEDYAERAWDLFHGREGNQQAATPVHLQAGLFGAAYDAVRKRGHAELKTRDAEGAPAEERMQLLLKTLKNELFFIAFYSQNVWRLQTESMQQYIIR